MATLELFANTVENRFVFQLFDLLVCGIIALLIVRVWRGRSQTALERRPLAFLFAAFSLLGASFAAAAVHSAALLFFRVHLPAIVLDGLGYGLRFGACVLIIANQRRFAGRALRIIAISLLLVASVVDMGLPAAPARISAWLWNLDQWSWLAALFTFAVAIGEAGKDLFDRVFVRLQIAFVLLASVMILVIVQTETADYQASIRSRSDQLAAFARAQTDYYLDRGQTLASAAAQEDIVERLTLGFGDLPALRVVRIAHAGELATFDIAPSGFIRRGFTKISGQTGPEIDPDEYFLIQALPLYGKGKIEFFGAREFLHVVLRKRIVLIFTVFTAMVALSTVMIGAVVRNASATIREQDREIEQTQRQLMQASKLAAIGELSAGVAHEINNPVTTILSRASLLAMQEDEEASEKREDLDAIVTQAQRIAQITKGLLVFSRPQTVNLEPAPVCRVIDAALRSVNGLVEANHIEIMSWYEPRLPRAMADEDNLARAFENLFRNAVDAMPNGGTLEVRAQRDGKSRDRLRLTVTDNGTGIPEEHLSRIFDPFFTTKAVGKGAGLGLSIVHGIIQEHRGAIAVTSRPGVGTCFEIVLPTEQSS